MIALFKDRSDNGLFLAEFQTVYYLPETRWLCFSGSAGDESDEIIIADISSYDAEKIIREIYEQEKTDLTRYLAYVNDEPDSPDEPHETKGRLFESSQSATHNEAHKTWEAAQKKRQDEEAKSNVVGNALTILIFIVVASFLVLPKYI